MNARILIIDDDSNFLTDLSMLLESEFECITANDSETGLALLQKKAPDVVLLDLLLEDEINGIDILKKIQQYDNEIPVIMVTDYASVDTAVEAIQCGAFDYISKTPNIQELHQLIVKSLEQRLLKARANSLQEEIQQRYHRLIGDSQPMQKLREQIALCANNLNTVLITGESGVGKELVAHQIHLQSDLRHAPFVAVNCAAIPKELIESELFGHEKGAFTGADQRKTGKFEIAGEGILFFDEVSELLPDAQAKLLRVIQERTFERVGGSATLHTEAKIIAATNRELRDMVEESSFREDLYYRLDVLRVRVPTLAERENDIPILVDHFLESIAADLKQPKKTIADEAMQLLIEYSWPGNVRELRNYLTRAVIISPGATIQSEHFHSGLESRDGTRRKGKIPKTWTEMDTLRQKAADEARRKVERRFVIHLLDQFDGNVTRAAEHAGINRSNLHKLMKRCGVTGGK